MASIVIGANENFDVEPYLNERARQARQALLENEFAWNQQLGAAHLGLQQQQLGLEAQRQQQAYGLQQQQFGQHQNEYQQALQQHLADQDFQRQMEAIRAKQAAATAETMYGPRGYQAARDVLLGGQRAREQETMYGPGGYQDINEQRRAQLQATRDELLGQQRTEQQEAMYGEEGYQAARDKRLAQQHAEQQKAMYGPEGYQAQLQKQHWDTQERIARAREMAAEQKMTRQAMASSPDARVVEAYLQGDTTRPPPPPEPDVEGYNNDPYDPRPEATERANYNRALQKVKTKQNLSEGWNTKAIEKAWTTPGVSVVSRESMADALGLEPGTQAREEFMTIHPVHRMEVNLAKEMASGDLLSFNALWNAVNPHTITDAEFKQAQAANPVIDRDKYQKEQDALRRGIIKDYFEGQKVDLFEVRAKLREIARNELARQNANNAWRAGRSPGAQDLSGSIFGEANPMNAARNVILNRLSSLPSYVQP